MSGERGERIYATDELDGWTQHWMLPPPSAEESFRVLDERWDDTTSPPTRYILAYSVDETFRYRP